jgi:rod shape-determining protein MreB and related proteins
MDKGIVYIGMDLGTFKTSVASSVGVRDVIYSAVGRPRDHVAHALLGRDVVFGKDILEHRLALNIIRPFEKGVLKYNNPKEAGLPQEAMDSYREAARLLVEHAVALTRPPKGVPVYGVIGAPSRASIVNKKVLLEAARTSFDVVMIVSEPFAIAYGMNRLSDTLVIDLGAGTIDICPIFGTFPTEKDQVTIPFGGDVIDEQFYHRLRALYPQAQLSLNMAREIKEKYGFVHDVNEKAQVMLPVGAKPKQFDVTVPLKEACQTIVPPILEGLSNVVARLDPEIQQRMLNNIVLGGGGSQLKGLDRVIEENLKEYGGARVKKVGDAVYAGAVGALKLAMSLPQDCWNNLKTFPAQTNSKAAAKAA